MMDVELGCCVYSVTLFSHHSYNCHTMGGIISRWCLGRTAVVAPAGADDVEEAAGEQNPDETDTPPGPHLLATDLPLGCHLQDEGTCQGAYKIEYMC